LVAYLESVPYGTIAKRLGLTTKAVDNAMQRIRRKLRKAGGVK
jgi:DNA-directed RNA polymerase specialized sigma24 family protein